MAHRELDKLGRFITENLWDRAIEHHDLMVKGHSKAPALQELQKHLAGLGEKQKNIVRLCVIEALNSGMHGLLFALQEAHDLNKGIELLVDGKSAADLSDGLHGEPYTSDGWVARFSKYPRDGR